MNVICILACECASLSLHSVECERHSDKKNKIVVFPSRFYLMGEREGRMHHSFIYLLEL